MKRFEVTFQGELHGTPDQVWDAITVHADGWLWPIEYEPRAGGDERGLSPSGGTVTEWEPARRFVTRAESATGWWNQLEYELAPSGEHTWLDYRHTSVAVEDEYDRVLDACERHTAFYYHSLGQYVQHFGGRDAAYEAVDTGMTFAAVHDALGAPASATPGDELALGVVDYATPHFLGIRGEDALYRVYGREAWGMPVAVAQHVFGGEGLRLDEILISEVAS